MRRCGVGGIDDREYHKTAGVPSTGRQSIYEMREPRFDLGAFLDQHLPRLRDGQVLDAGCGPGAYVADALARAREVTALDIAQGRLDLIDRRARRVCGDVQNLPFGDATFDAAMAMHMLYHVPDIALAASELRRVVRPGGVLYALTNSQHAQSELQDLIDRHGCDPFAGGEHRFTNENGAGYLRTAFAEVRLTEFHDSRLVVTDPECVVDEVHRNRYVIEPGMRAGRTWDSFLAAIRTEVTETIGRLGAFVMSEEHGLFTCR
jgi:SAM-dependent methyltransferase